jgi:hypothetical protein
MVPTRWELARRSEIDVDAGNELAPLDDRELLAVLIFEVWLLALDGVLLGLVLEVWLGTGELVLGGILMGLVLGGPGRPWSAPSRGFNLLSKRQNTTLKREVIYCLLCSIYTIMH